MDVKYFVNGPFMVNTYLLIQDNEAIVIDPGHVCSALINYIKENNFDLKTVLITHGHIDHIAGINQLRNEFKDLTVYMNEADQELVDNADKQAQLFGLTQMNPVEIDKNIDESGTLQIGNFTFELYHVPGHSQGSICFYINERIFTGDTLFCGSIGRTDLPGGDYDLLLKSIREKLMPLPPETKIFPGHGGSSTIGFEEETNPYINRGV